MTELLEIEAPSPTMHILFIPGNPGFLVSFVIFSLIFGGKERMTLDGSIAGVITFYKDFLESLYERLDGKASITGMCMLMASSLHQYLFFII